MKSHVRVAVIGGGVVGCSVLYHLCRGGWSDVVLLERDELTCGSSWHAAGSFHTVNGNINIAKLQKYTIELYRQLEIESGQSTSVRITGGLMLAATEDRFDWLKSIHAKGKYCGFETEIVSAQEAHRRMPLLDPAQFVGAVYDEAEGHLDPSGTTHAYAKAARKRGAEVYLRTKVEALRQRREGGWEVVTNRGTIVAEHVVNAGGLWAREVGAMAGISVPVMAMAHQYLITEDMPEVLEINQSTGKEVLHAVDFDGELYLRQERNGMLMGTYEKNCRPWSPVTTPWDFGHELLEPEIDRITPELEVGFSHFPCFAHTGIKQIIHGPFTFTPDGNPLVGPVRGAPGMWSACGVMAGFAQGGGVGLALANWMIEDDPGFDIFAMDVARFGDFATAQYTRVKVPENYSRRFSIRFPNEELPAARPLRTTPIYSELAARGAQFGAAFGLEVPLWYAPSGVSEQFSWRRSSDFEHVGAEARAVRAAVGVTETSGFAKYRVSGTGAEAWLDHLLACRLPDSGRMTLAPMLDHRGKVIGDFTLANLGSGEWLIIGSGAAEEYHMRWFQRNLPADNSVTLEAISLGLVGLAIAGPLSRQLLAELCDEDVSNEAFPFLHIRKMNVAMSPSLVGRVSYTGDLGYEFWLKPEYQTRLLADIMNAGECLGIKPFGARALNSLRLEKGYGSWAADYRPIYTPYECGLGRFIALNKTSDFIGKQAAAKCKQDGGGNMRMRTFVVEAIDSEAIGDEPIYHNGTVVGWVTSGGYAHHCDLSMAVGYVPKELADKEEGWAVDILGHHLPARMQRRPRFDPDAERMRG